MAEAQGESNGAHREDVRSGRETLPGEWERVLVVGLPALRQAYGWSQEELARRSGLHRRTIMRIEGNEANRPQASMQTIEALAHAFGYGQVRDLWVAVQTVVATDPGTPLIVGARLRRVVEALMECTPQQQQLIESVILGWAARRQAAALGEAHLLDLDAIRSPGETG